MAAELDDLLAVHPRLNFITYNWVDLMGVLRERTLSISHACSLLASGGQISVGPGLLYCSYVNEPGECRVPRAARALIQPAWSSLRCESADATRATVMCYVHEEVDDMGDRRCPRAQLTRLMGRASAEFHLDLLVGFELEFWLLRPREDHRVGWEVFPSPSVWAATAALRGQPRSILEEICLTLKSAQIDVEQYSTEDPTGLFEISTGPQAPLQAIDALIFSVETIKTISARHGLKASFVPRFNGGHAGQHVHLSLSKAGLGDFFLAGVLNHMGTLCAFTLPTIDSYDRTKDLAGTNGTWVGCGTQIRDVPIRKIDESHWEFRFVDGTANMYLAVASIVYAGLSGISQQLSLEYKDVNQSPSLMTNDERRRHGITRRMPSSLTEALADLGTNREFQE